MQYVVQIVKALEGMKFDLTHKYCSHCGFSQINCELKTFSKGLAKILESVISYLVHLDLKGFQKEQTFIHQQATLNQCISEKPF